MSDVGLLPAPRHLETGGPGPRAGEPLAPRVERDAALPPEGYELEISAAGIALRHADAHGLRYARQALDQLRVRWGAELPGVRIRDWPDYPTRGFMLDISRDRVPTMETLGRIVETLAALRLNQLQLYTEHTFAYARHEAVWRDASPMTAEEIRELDTLCAERGIELVPNQNSFGHMERWLRHSEYRSLAELPDGWTGADGSTRAPACLAPDDDSLAFVRALHRELLPNFHSRSVNIGCDETFDLGRGRSRAACEQRGRGRVYLDFLARLVKGLQSQGYTVQFWGDVIASHPELVSELPRDGLVALVWGYEAPTDPETLPAELRDLLRRFGMPPETLRGFAERLRPFAERDVPFWVCPGTSSWNSLIGRWPNARANLLDAAEAGLRAGACGYLITDWGDNGHLQPWPVSLLPLAYGAAVSWCAAANRELDVETALSDLVLGDPTGELARALAELGSAYGEVGLTGFNASPLFLALQVPIGQPVRAWGETSQGRLDRVHEVLDRAGQRLREARPAIPDGARMRRELAQAAHLARHGALRLARAYTHGGPPDDELLEDLDACIQEQREVWLGRSREGGLDDSLARLRRGAGLDPTPGG